MPSLSDLKTTNASYWRYSGGIPAWILSVPMNAWDSLIDLLIAALASITPYVPANITAPMTVGASPWTYTAGGGPEIVYISGGSINSITRNGVAITVSGTCTVILAPTKSVVINYGPGTGSTPTVVVDR